MKLLLISCTLLAAVALAAEPQTVTLPGLVVTADKNGKRIEAAGKVANTNGILEFVAVEPEGREYESLLTLTTKPSVLQSALLLLGCETGLTTRVKLELVWGTNRHATVESWLVDRKTKKPPAALQWAFTGSRFVKHPVTGKQVFQADEERAHIALWFQSSIPINLIGEFGNPYKYEAQGFEVNTTNVPPVGTPVTLILRP
jgi:hypothetical protein